MASCPAEPKTFASLSNPRRMSVGHVIVTPNWRSHGRGTTDGEFGYSAVDCGIDDGPGTRDAGGTTHAKITVGRTKQRRGQ